MKRSYLFFTLAVISFLVVAIYSCDKGNILNQNTDDQSLPDDKNETGDEISFRSEGFDYSQCPTIKSTVSKSGDMLVFQDMAHFENCVICLEKDYEDYNDAYEAQYPNATPEELDSLDVVNNFDEWTPYISFESSHNFSSLRAKIENEIIQWLDSTPAEEIDFADAPDSSVPVIDESTRALLNESGLAKVGTDTVTLDDWQEKDFWDECGFLTTQEYTFDYNDDPLLVNRQLIVKIRVKSGLLNSNLIGKITNKRKVNGKYKRRRATLKIGVTGSSFNGDCVVMPQFWSKYKGYKKRKSPKVNAYIWMLWREALVDRGDPRWMQERCVAHGYWDNDNKYYPVALSR